MKYIIATINLSDTINDRVDVYIRWNNDQDPFDMMSFKNRSNATDWIQIVYPGSDIHTVH